MESSSMSGFPVLHCLLEFAEIHVHWLGDHPLVHWNFSVTIKEPKLEPRSIKRTERNKKRNGHLDANSTWQVLHVSHWKTELIPDIYVYILICGCFWLVVQSCLTLCDPMDCSMPGFPVHHKILEFSNSCPYRWQCHPIVSFSVVPSSSCLQSFPASVFFSKESVLCIRWPKYCSFSFSSVLPMNIRDWFPLGFTSWISLQS